MNLTNLKYVQYELIDGGTIARITLARPEKRNAQNRGLLVELDELFVEAEQDDNVRVVILRGAGPIFSAGHDMGSAEHLAERAVGSSQHPTMQINGGTRDGAEKRMLQEWHYFFENTRRWRDLRKITIAEVNGDVYAAGLMLVWACDLIVAERNALFADVVGTRLGMCGVEYFGHPWEFGPRRAKELLLTGDAISAEEAHSLGMVSRLYAREDLAEGVLALARKIVRLPTVTALLIKEAVNQSQDAMGFQSALRSAFMIHQLNHSHWAEVTNGDRISAPPGVSVHSWSDAPDLQRSRTERA